MSRQDVLPKEKLIQMQMKSGTQISCSIKNVQKLPKFMMNLKMSIVEKDYKKFIIKNAKSTSCKYMESHPNKN